MGFVGRPTRSLRYGAPTHTACTGQPTASGTFRSVDGISELRPYKPGHCSVCGEKVPANHRNDGYNVERRERFLVHLGDCDETRHQIALQNRPPTKPPKP